MDTPSNPPRRRTSRRKRRRSRTLQALAGLWSEWRVEIAIAILLSLGTFLLVERMQIRRTILVGLKKALEGLGSLADGAFDSVASSLRNASISDVIGFIVLAVALVLVVRRARWRLMTMSRFTERKCPRCGGDLHRIHRRWRDRLLNRFLPVRRYQCKERDCRWHGLRTGRSQHD